MTRADVPRMREQLSGLFPRPGWHLESRGAAAIYVVNPEVMGTVIYGARELRPGYLTWAWGWNFWVDGNPVAFIHVDPKDTAEAAIRAVEEEAAKYLPSDVDSGLRFL